MALQEGRYTYRHDNILKYISDCLDRVKFTCYVDIPGCQTPAGGTLPPSLVVTALRPDIVIMDKQKKEVNVFELTVPGETRNKISHNLKYQNNDIWIGMSVFFEQFIHYWGLQDVDV